MATDTGGRTNDCVVEIENLHFSRGTRQIFAGVNISIRRGEVAAIMGPSGTGKTTLLRLIGGQLRPDAGRIRIDGVDVHTLKRRALYQLRKRMGMLFQSGALFTHLNCFENVAFPLREHTRLSQALIRHLVLIKLEAVGLRGAHALYPAELSGGMARRVALARALALDPMVVMYDEPFSGQDPISMGILVRLIRLLNDALGLTSIVVSHDVAETAEIADRVHVISAGKVVESGSPQALRASSSEWVQQFLNALPDGPVPFHYPGPSLEEDLLGHRGAGAAL
ncbi:MAG: ABC transporter ATP-binding protein [Nitrococcus mobilis]|nr:ABC transporter ATP-binding protein [Nitrococcus mobilis]